MHSALFSAALLGLTDYHDPVKAQDDRFVDRGKMPKYRPNRTASKFDDKRTKAKAARRANNRRKSK